MMKSAGKSDADNSIEEELRLEIEQYPREKEQIKAIVGSIGGSSTQTEKIVNIIFLTLRLNVFNPTTSSGAVYFVGFRIVKPD